MSRDAFHFEPLGVLALADVFDEQRRPLEELAGRLRQAVQPVDTGASDLDAHTRTSVGQAADAIVLCGQVFEALTDGLDDTIRKFQASNRQATVEMREMWSRLPAPPGS